MVNTTPSKSLSGVRTFAKDMAKNQALSDQVVNKPDTLSNPAQKPVPKAEPRIYQAPSWTGNKNKSLPKKPESQNLEEKPKPEQTLQPISAPKIDRETIIVSNDNDRQGVIITDSKRNRFRLFPAILKSIQQWFTDLSLKRAVKMTPKYTVPETSLRKGVIQRATSKTGKFASADSLSIHERIRLRKEKATPKTPTTIWTANTEPGFPLLKAGENRISNIKVVLKKSLQNLTEEVTPREVPPQPKAPIVIITKAPVATLPNTNNIPIEFTETVVIKPPPIAIPVLETITVIPFPEPIVEHLVNQSLELTPLISTKEERVAASEKVTRLKPTSLKEWLFSRSINTISIGVFAVVLALIIVSVSGYVWLNSKLPPPTINTAPNYQTLIDGPLQLIYPKTLTRAGLFEEVINSFKNTEGEVAQQIFVASVDGKTLLKPETVLDTMDFSLEPAFLKSVSYIYFGGLRKNIPFVLIDTTDYTTTRGGMLNWETTMSEDLSPFFNYNQPYDAGTVKTAIFVDAVINQTDVRILRTLSGAELLVYGLINRDIVIITTNSTSFTEIKNLLK